MNPVENFAEHRDSEMKPALQLRLGLDIDGTITLDPKLFAEIATYCKQSGGEVHIVTSRSELSRRDTLAELRGYGVRFDSIYFLGEMSRADKVCPHKELDWFQRYLWQKIAYAKQHALTQFVDDDPKVLSLFATFAPEIVATPAGTRVKIADPLYEQAVHAALVHQQVSVALVQRRLLLSDERAIRLIKAMAEAGIVGAHPGQDDRHEIQEKYRQLSRNADRHE